MPEFFAYIDESGDEGVNRGRQWFAVAVEAGREFAVRANASVTDAADEARGGQHARGQRHRV